MSRFWLLLPLLASGCLSDRGATPMVANDSFAPVLAESKARPVPQDAPPATQETATRVTRVAGKVLEANPQIGLRPSFSTIGVKEAEIFHRGAGEVFITEGLTNQCTTDGQLAAVLALELGKMVSEREAAAGIRNYEREPPANVGVGRDNSGTFGPADGTQLYLLSQYEKQRPQRGAPPPTPPDSRLLARIYLQKSGYSAADLEGALPLVKQAQGNVAVEKQMLNGSTHAKPAPQ